LSSLREYNENATYKYCLNFGEFILQVQTEAERSSLESYLSQKDISYNENKTSLVLDGITYSLKYIMDELEAFRVNNLKNENKYFILSDKSRLILDLPIIEWKLGWQHSAAFLLHWLVLDNAGDIKFDNAKQFLSQYSMFTDCLNEGIETINKGDIYTIGHSKDALNVLINEIKLIDVGKQMSINLKNELQQNPNPDNYIAYSDVSISKFLINYDDLKASFGRFGVLFYYTGMVTKTEDYKALVTINNVYYRINDFFDFSQDNGFITYFYEDQPLGNWEWDVVNPTKPKAGGYLLNKSFRDFSSAIGKDLESSYYQTVTNYVQIENKPITQFEIDLKNAKIQNIK